MGMFKLIDVRVDRWLSLDYLKETSRHFQAIFRGTFVPQKPRYSETFEEAVQRLELSENDLIQRQFEFTRLFYFFIVLSLIVIGYGLYLAYFGHFIGAIVSFCLALYSFTQAFRFHFWLFQLKHRKLGCTLKEWFFSSTVLHLEHRPEDPS